MRPLTLFLLPVAAGLLLQAQGPAPGIMAPSEVRVAQASGAGPDHVEIGTDTVQFVYEDQTRYFRVVGITPVGF